MLCHLQTEISPQANEYLFIGVMLINISQQFNGFKNVILIIHDNHGVS